MGKHENVFWKLASTARVLQRFADRLYVAANQRKAKEAYGALHHIEKHLHYAAALGLENDDVIDGEPVTPEPKGYVDSRKFCHCCGAWRRLEALRCSIGIHECVQVEEYKRLSRPPGACYEQSPQLIAGVGVYRNGGTSEDHHICNDCLQLGLRYARDRINELLGETDCLPVAAQKMEQASAIPSELQPAAEEVPS